MIFTSIVIKDYDLHQHRHQRLWSSSASSSWWWSGEASESQFCLFYAKQPGKSWSTEGSRWWVCRSDYYHHYNEDSDHDADVYVDKDVYDDHYEDDNHDVDVEQEHLPGGPEGVLDAQRQDLQQLLSTGDSIIITIVIIIIIIIITTIITTIIIITLDITILIPVWLVNNQSTNYHILCLTCP